MHDATSWAGVHRVVHERIYGALRAPGLAGSIIHAKKERARAVDLLRVAYIEAGVILMKVGPKLATYVPLRGPARLRFRRLFYRLLHQPLP